MKKHYPLYKSKHKHKNKHKKLQKLYKIRKYINYKQAKGYFLYEKSSLWGFIHTYIKTKFMLYKLGIYYTEKLLL
jgi:hypothetical protein